MADRIMVMNRGCVEQIGTPFDIYTHPRTLFVADFIGQANALPGTLEAAESPERGVMAAGGQIGCLPRCATVSRACVKMIATVFWPLAAEACLIRPKQSVSVRCMRGTSGIFSAERRSRNPVCRSAAF